MKGLKFYSLFSFTLLALSTYASKDEKIKIESLIFDIENNVASVTAIGFPYTDEIVIPSQIEVEGELFPVTSIGENAFSGSTVKILTIPSSIKSMGDGAFIGTNIEKLYIESLESWCDIDFAYDTDYYGHNFIANSSANPIRNSTEIYVDGVQLIELVIPDGLKEIKDFTFSGLKVSKVIFPSSLTKIGHGAFKALSTEEITLPANIEYIGVQSFEKSAIQKLTIDEGANLKIDKWAFSNCLNLSDIYFYGSAVIYEEVFVGCFLDIYLYSQVGSVWNGFSNAIIHSVEVPSVDIWGCSFISDPEVIDYVYILLVNGIEPKELIVPYREGYKYSYSLSGISSVEQGGFEEGIEKIFEVRAMQGLRNLILPSTLKYFDSINNCPELVDIEIKSSTPPENGFSSNTSQFRQMKSLFENCTLRVPDYAIEAYKNDPGWGNFKNIQGESFAGIDEVKKEPENDSQIIYDLSGKRVNPEDLTNGIYIVNGKRFYSNKHSYNN